MLRRNVNYGVRKIRKALLEKIIIFKNTGLSFVNIFKNTARICNYNLLRVNSFWYLYICYLNYHRTTKFICKNVKKPLLLGLQKCWPSVILFSFFAAFFPYFFSFLGGYASKTWNLLFKMLPQKEKGECLLVMRV